MAPCTGIESWTLRGGVIRNAELMLRASLSCPTQVVSKVSIVKPSFTKGAGFKER